MEHNYNNLHLEGNYNQQRKMVHNQIPVKHSSSWFSVIGNLVGAFMAVAIGTVVLSQVTQTLRKEGVI